MRIHQLGFGLAMLLGLGSCSNDADSSTTATSNVSIRVSGFVEAAGIT